MSNYGYTRVSTGTQAEKGYGLEAQEAAIVNYAKEKGLTLDGCFTDAGVSGNLKDTDTEEAIEKRHGLMELLAVLEKGDTVIILNTSRLWRSDMTKVIVRRELMRKEAHVISIEQPTYDLYSKDPNEYLISGMMELLDAYERMTIAMKLARGRATKARAGDKPAGLCPYGYQYSADKKSIEIDPEEAQTIKRIYTEAQTGMSLMEISKGLNRDGIKNKLGRIWQRAGVAVVLHNRFYLGELTHGGKIIQGNHQPIISKIQFGKVQAALTKKNKRAGE